MKDQQVPIEVLLIDADGVIQYAPEDWSDAFTRCLGRDDPVLARRFTADIYAAETACLSRVGGFSDALHEVLSAWNCMAQKPLVLQAMLSIRKHDEVLELIAAVRASGTRCYVASNQQTQRAEFMSTSLGYASMFDGELYSCNLGAAKPSERYFELALKAVGAHARSTLFIDDRPENVSGARRAGLASFVYDGRSGAAVLKSRLRDFGIATS
jgi:putative hydrolase of the HAD superfamily